MTNYINSYSNPQQPRELTHLPVASVSSITHTMCVVLGGEFYLIQDIEDENHAFDAYVTNSLGTFSHVEIWHGSRGWHGMVGGVDPVRLYTEQDLADLLRCAKGMGMQAAPTPRKPPPHTLPTLVSYAGLAGKVRLTQ
jgi:hypothetical protein